MNRLSSILLPEQDVNERNGMANRSPSEDRALFERFLGGDDDAFVELMGRHAPRLYLYAAKILGDRAQARDLMQDVWERIIRFRSEGKPAPESPLGLLIRITRNLCLNHNRSRKNHLPLEEVPEWRQPRAGGRELTELEEAVVIALERLPLDQREVLILNAYSGYRFDEIAEMLGEQESTIRTRAWRARARLGRMIAALIDLGQSNDASSNDDTRSGDPT